MEKEFTTTFAMDFAIAERFGKDAVLDTFKRAFNEWKNDIRYLAHLTIVTNNRCWELYGKDNELSEMYAKMYYTCRDYAYDDNSPFTDEDCKYYFDMTD